jgi:hypothetical protein
MSQHHQTLLAAAKVAIDKVFNDKSVDQSTTKESLDELVGEIEVMLDSLSS